jgi:hypothetical protein
VRICVLLDSLRPPHLPAELPSSSATISLRPTMRAVISANLLLLLAAPLINATCYWQNSTLALDAPSSIAPDDTACFPDQTNSPCCGTGWTCLSDGVCYIEQDGNPFYYRGTCTDRTWNSQQCPGWCFAQNSNTSIPLAKCTEANGEDWYCCPGEDNCNCDTGVDALKLGASQPTTVTVIGSTSWPGYVSTSSGFSTSAFALDGTTTQIGVAASTTSVVVTSTGTKTATTTSSRSSSGTGSAAAASSTSQPKNVPVASNTAAISGGVIAGVVALALIGALGWFLGRRHYRRKAATSGVEKPYAPETGAGADNQVGAWAAAQQNQQSGYAGSELPCTGSHTRSEAPGDEIRRHELGGYYGDGVRKSRPDGAAEMQG